MDRPLFKLLLVEDNEDDVMLARVMLADYQRAQFEIEAVATAEHCLQRVGHAPIDLVLLDYGLPGENGLALLMHLAVLPAAPPVIMLTGQGDERIAREAIRRGAYDYFPKDSITSGMLGHAIHQVLEKFRVERQLADERLEGTERVIFALASAAEAKDTMTESHLQRMAVYAVVLGRALGLDERQLLLLRYGGLLHDIGKIGVSEAIIRKPAPLNADEWREMRQHPIIGERICVPLRLADALCPIVRHHHERWDGTGYVDGLAGEAIPLLARVISVVDAFDSMSSDRPYRAALPRYEVLRQLEHGAGSHFDPDIAATFARLVREGGVDLPADWQDQRRAA